LPDGFHFSCAHKADCTSDLTADSVVLAVRVSCTESRLFSLPVSAEVSVSFDRESSVTYTFQEPFSVMQNRSSQASSVSTDSRAREDVAFSFVTSQRPAMLLTVSTFSQQYIAVILTRNGMWDPCMNTHMSGGDG